MKQLQVRVTQAQTFMVCMYTDTVWQSTTVISFCEGMLWMFDTVPALYLYVIAVAIANNVI